MKDFFTGGVIISMAKRKTEVSAEKLFGGFIEIMKTQMENAIENIQEDMKIPWDEDDSVIGMRPDEGGPLICLYLQDDETDELAYFRFTVDEFLDETEDFYSYGEDGWVDEMIDDLEILKAKIQERIDKMRLTIEQEQI